MADVRAVVAAPPLDLGGVLSRGRWREALILTYSFDLPFFESYVLPKLVGNGCRSIAAAACASWLPQRLAGWSEARDIAEAGVSYSLSQVAVPGVFHPKLLLAVGPDLGAVLVGSGNISEEGLAGGGDLFTLLEWTGEVPALAREAWQLCRELARRLVVDQTFGERVEAIGRLVPALAAPVQEHRLVHNLDAPILEQFLARVPGGPVEELLVWSPFTDRRLAALRTLVGRLRPSRVVVAVQPGITRLDGDRLARLRAAHPETAWETRELQQRAPLTGGMIHAKGILATIGTGEAFALLGSPNLSAPALLRSAAEGNFEIAVVHQGADLRRTLFGEGGPVAIGDEVERDALAWEPDATTEDARRAAPACQLLGARQQGDWLAVELLGAPPPDATLVLDRGPSVELTRHADGWGAVLAGGPSPRIVEVRWDGGHAGPVVVHDLHQLAQRARGTDTPRHTPLAALDYGADSDILALLEELAGLAIVSVYDVARMIRGERLTPELESLEAGDEPPLASLDDIDFERVRQHPRARAYDLTPGDGYDTPRLVLWLDEVVQQFERRRDVQLRGVEAPVPDGDIEDELPEPAEPDPRRWSDNRRVAVLVRNRIRRAVSGMADPRFWELVDPAWVTVNYAIWLNFIERLWARAGGPSPILAERDLAPLTVGLLAGYWGDDRRAGYLSRLTDDERFAAALLLADRHADALTAAACIRLLESHGAGAPEAPFVAGQFAKNAGPLGLLTEEVLERALVYLDRADEPPGQYLQRLRSTEDAFTWDRFAANLAWRHHRRSAAVRSEAPGAGRFRSGDVLVVDGGQELPLTAAALRVFADWVLEVRSRDPERAAIHMAWGSGLILIYDVLDRAVLQRPTAGGRTATVADGVLPEDIAAIELGGPSTAIA